MQLQGDHYYNYIHVWIATTMPVDYCQTTKGMKSDSNAQPAYAHKWLGTLYLI